MTFNAQKTPMSHPRGLGWLVALAVFATVVLVRGYYVQHFASALPFWDQWDAEGDQLIRPWIDGTLRLESLWQLHNEHRIVPTRLTTLAVFVVSGTWSNLWEARVNVFLSAAVAATFVWIAFRRQLPTGTRWLFVALVLACFTLPFAWENFLVGFQSQFCYVVLFMLAALILTAWRPDSMLVRCAVFVLCLASVVTLASGLVTALAVSFVVGLAWYIGDRPMRPPVIFIVMLWIVAISSYLSVPHIPEHATLKAQGAFELVDASTHILGWPTLGYHWPAFWLWLPGAMMISWIVWGRQASRVDLVMAGCYVWTAAQALALAYGRGHLLLEVPSRYTELLIPGILANGWFVLRFAEHATRLRQARAFAYVIASAFFIMLTGGYALRLEGDIGSMRARHDQFALQTSNVVRYLQTHDPAALRQPAMQVPYPDVPRLQQWLDDPVIAGSLPPIAHGVGRPPATLSPPRVPAH